MKKKSDNEADALFRHSTSATKELHKAAKKQLREKKRKDWWAEHGKKGYS